MTWQSQLGWDEGQSRRVQLICGIIGLVLLFCGVVMQWWAGNNFSDITLSTLCKSYSGDDRLIEYEDWATLKDVYYNFVGQEGPVLSVSGMAAYFFSAGSDFQIETFLNAEPSFWCKSLPECPVNTKCGGNPYAITEVLPGGYAPGVWIGRSVSTEAYWKLPADSNVVMTTHIRCWDKYLVYRDMLNAILKNQGAWVKGTDMGEAYWSEESVNSAAFAVLYSCYNSKGSTGYILGLGPALSSLACIICTISLCTCKCTPRAYTAALGRGLSILAFAMILIGFWVVVFSSVSEIANAYLFCGSQGKPLVEGGTYLDGSPCLDRNSKDEKSMNPFIWWSGHMTAVYTGGGVLNIMAVMLLLVAIAKTIEDQQLRNFATLTPSDEVEL